MIVDWLRPSKPVFDQYINNRKSAIHNRRMSSSAVQPLLALLACPVGGNPTQYMIEKAVAHHDLDWRYLTFEVGPDDLGDAVRGLRALGFRGAHCAPPHKQAVLPLLDRMTDTAAMIGAVNLILREENALVGENTEGKGVVESIRAALDPAGKTVVLLGAGQIARAVAVELAAAGVAALIVVNRTDSRAAELVAALSGKFAAAVSSVSWLDDYAVPPEADLLVNATSIEHVASDAPLRLVVDTLRPELFVADATANSTATWLLSEARERGCKTDDGLSMFIEQVAIGLRLWTGVDPNRQVLRDAAEEFLGL
jgi:shikimate dehydrogenase